MGKEHAEGTQDMKGRVIGGIGNVAGKISPIDSRERLAKGSATLRMQLALPNLPRRHYAR
jgi:hypothetical protein